MDQIGIGIKEQHPDGKPEKYNDIQVFETFDMFRMDLQIKRGIG